MKLNHPVEIRDFFLKQISDLRISGRGPIRHADSTYDLITLKLHIEFTAPDVFSREIDPAIAFSAGFHGLSNEGVGSCVLWIGE